MISRIAMRIYGGLSIGDRMLIGTYMGGPLQKALPWRLRIMAICASIYLRFNPQTMGESEEECPRS